MFKNESCFLKEWIDFYLLAGVEHFYLYNNLSDDDYLQVLKPYVDKGLVTLIDWNIPMGHMKAYFDCVEKYSAESNWIGFFDLDEFAVPLQTMDLKQCLRKYNQFPSLSVYWKMFGANGIVDYNKDKLVSEQFILSYDFNSYKSFLNTKFSKWIWSKSRSPHFFKFKFFNRICPKNPAYYVGFRKSQINPDIQLNHYYCKSYEYFCSKKQIGRQLDEKEKMSLQKFFDVDCQATTPDYQIFKYMIKLKTFELDNIGELVCL